MKLITHIYAIIICSILSLAIIAFLAIAFPIAIIIEVMTFVREAVSNEGFYHGIWIRICRDCFIYIKNVYSLIINDPYED